MKELFRASSLFLVTVWTQLVVMFGANVPISTVSIQVIQVWRCFIWCHCHRSGKLPSKSLKSWLSIGRWPGIQRSGVWWVCLVGNATGHRIFLEKTKKHTPLLDEHSWVWRFYLWKPGKPEMVLNNHWLYSNHQVLQGSCRGSNNFRDVMLRRSGWCGWWHLWRVTIPSNHGDPWGCFIFELGKCFWFVDGAWLEAADRCFHLVLPAGRSI